MSDGYADAAERRTGSEVYSEFRTHWLVVKESACFLKKVRPVADRQRVVDELATKTVESVIGEFGPNGGFTVHLEPDVNSRD